MSKQNEIYLCDEPVRLVRLELKNLSPEKRRAVRELHRRRDSHGFRILLFFSVYALAAYAGVNFETAIVQAASCLGIVCAMVGFSVVLHEASHRSLFERPAVNDAIGFVCGLPVLIPVAAFRANHIGHHARRSSKADPEDVAFPRLNKATTLASNVLVFLVKAFAFILILPVSVIVRADRKARMRIALEYGLMSVLCAGLLWMVPFALIWKLWLLPLIIGALLTQLRAIAEHGLTTRGNVFTATRTVTSNRLVAFLMCNINYHLEHHLFPAVPWYNLPKLHRLLREEYGRAGASSYRSYAAFFSDLIKTAWAGSIPNGRLIPVETRRTLGC